MEGRHRNICVLPWGEWDGAMRSYELILFPQQPQIAAAGTCGPANQISVGWSKNKLVTPPTCNGKWCYKWLCPERDKLNQALSRKDWQSSIHGEAFGCVWV